MRNSRFRGKICSKNHELDFYNFSSVEFALQMSRGTSTADFKYIKLVYFAKHQKKGFFGTLYSKNHRSDFNNLVGLDSPRAALGHLVDRS
jgi:hypothetical protein